MGYKEGYLDAGDRRIKTEPISNSITGGYVEGYVDGGERNAKPFDPNTYPVTEIIVVPPAGGNGGILFVQYFMNINATTTDGDLITSESFSFQPLTTSDIYIVVNGLSIFPANGASELSTSAFYITDSTGTIIRPKETTYEVTDQFHWNGSVAGYELEVDDEIKIIYEV